MASLSINPTSNSFGSSGGSGSLAVNVETDNWHSTPQSGDIWMAQRKKTNGAWSSWIVFKIVGEDGEPGQDGDDGVGISNTVISYQGGSSGTTAPTGNWSSSPVSINPGQYLWTRIVFYYTNGTTKTVYSVSRYGEDGGAASNSPTMVYAGYFNKDPNTGNTKAVEYQGNSKVVSVVYDPVNNMYWSASPTAGDATTGTFQDVTSGGLPNTTPSSGLWVEFGASFDSIASGVVFAEKAYLEKAVVRMLETSSSNTKRVIISENQVVMYDDSNNSKLIISGENLGAISNNTTYVSTEDGEVTGNTKNINAEEDITSSFQITKAGNKVTLPAMDLNLVRSSSASYHLTFEACYVIDGVHQSITYFDGDEAVAGHTLTLPSLTISLPSGWHTIGVWVHATGTNFRKISWLGVTNAILIYYPSQQVQIGANGFRAAFSSTQYADFIKNGASEPVFTIRNGNYGIRVTSTGVQKTTSGDSGWQSL